MACKHKDYELGFTVTGHDPSRNIYGKVRLPSGRIIFRNYRRPILGGMSLFDLLRTKSRDMGKVVSRFVVKMPGLKRHITAAIKRKRRPPKWVLSDREKDVIRKAERRIEKQHAKFSDKTLWRAIAKFKSMPT